MANLIISFPNRVDECTLSGGSWEVTLPLTNLQDRIISKVARSTDDALASTKFDAALTKDRPIRVVVLVKHNISTAGLYRIRGSLVSDFSSTVYDSGWQDVWAANSSLTIDWEEDNYWDGLPTAEDIEGFNANLVHVLDYPIVARYWRIEIDDTTNADGYVEIGRLFMASQWQPPTNMVYGAALGYDTTTSIDAALNGTEYFDSRTNFRTFRFTLENLSYDEGHARALEAFKRLGIDNEVFIIPDPEDTTQMLRRAFLGRLKQLGALEYPYFDKTRAAFDIKEII